MIRKILIINGSPKKKSGTSEFLSKVMGCFLINGKVQYASVRTENEYPMILEQLKDIDALILAVPLYVDGIPSHVLDFLQQAEKFCLENRCRFFLYVISNNGFIEGIHNKVHLKMYECWCRRVSVAWGGGIGIGGGEMLHVLSIIFPVIFAVRIILNVIKYAEGIQVGFSDWIPLIDNMAVYLFFNIGVIYCMIRLAISVHKLRRTKNRYTRVMVPSFLYVPMADIFMTVTSLFQGKNIFSLLKRDVYVQKVGQRENSKISKNEKSACKVKTNHV